MFNVTQRGVACAAASLALICSFPATAHAGGAEPVPHPSPTADRTYRTGLDLAEIAARPPVTAVRTIGKVPLSRRITAASGDLRKYALPAGDQGNVQSCVAWALGYSAYGVIMNQAGRQGAPMAPMYVYSQLNHGRDKGISTPRALNLLTEQGIDTRAHYSHGDFDWRSQPSQADRDSAAHYQLSGYQEIPLDSDTAIPAVKTAINNEHPVVIGMQLHKNFMDMDATTAANYTYQPSGKVVGGHELAVVAYNDKGVTLQNSWGPTWGDHGSFTLPWSAFENGDIDEIHVMGSVSPEPTSAPSAPGENRQG